LWLIEVAVTTHWHALQSKPHKEGAVWQQIRAKGFEAFFPQVRVQTSNPRARKARPYFPGYLFVRADLEAVGPSTFQYMPHAVGLVSFGGEPARVPDNLIQAIQRKVGEIELAGGEVFYGLKPGDPVVILEGPFAGYRAIFDARLSGGERVRVLLDFLGRQTVPVELDAAQIEQKKRL
jgi:transcriptional antiterminator RfaH